ncbi:MAG TPA: PfkB family carbohydrate kinase [Dehalococcoidia bacterium]
MQAPDIVVVGHVTRDLTEAGPRLGGTGAYAGLVAARLGLRVGLLTRCGPEVDLSALAEAMEVHRLPDPVTTTFENRYVGGRRQQRVPALAGPIGPEDVPDAWCDAPMLLLGPVAGEVDAGVRERFPRAAVGVCGQGWLRAVGPDGRVEPREWSPASLLPGSHVLFVSDEDIPWIESREALLRWADGWPLVAWTHGPGGADVWDGGRWLRVPAYPAPEVDPTGAGDSFAAAFLVRWVETQDVAAAARFAAAASSFVVAAEGTAGIPSRSQVEDRLRNDPGVLAR